MEDPKTTATAVTHLLATFSVTFTGENDEPLLAFRIIADGKPVDVPFILMLGQSSEPLTLSGGMNRQENRTLFAEALTGLGMDLAKSVIAELRAATQPRATPEESGTTPSSPPSLDTVMNQ